MTIEYHPEADADAHKGIAEYERADPIVAAKFTEALLAAEADIEQRPLQFAVLEDSPVGFEVRERFVNGFPYSVKYLRDSAGVLIVAVAHHRRRPDYWHDRLLNKWQ